MLYNIFYSIGSILLMQPGQFQAALSFSFKVFSIFLEHCMHRNLCGIPSELFAFETNMGIYNSFMLIQYLIYPYFFQAILSVKNMKRLNTIFITLSIFWCYTTFVVFGFNRWTVMWFLPGIIQHYNVQCLYQPDFRSDLWSTWRVTLNSGYAPAP